MPQLHWKWRQDIRKKSSWERLKQLCLVKKKQGKEEFKFECLEQKVVSKKGGTGKGRIQTSWTISSQRSKCNTRGQSAQMYQTGFQWWELHLFKWWKQWKYLHFSWSYWWSTHWIIWQWKVVLIQLFWSKILF